MTPVCSGVTDRGEEGRADPLGKLNAKSEPPQLAFVFFWFSIGCCFFAFFGVFSFFLASIDIHDIRIHYYLLTFFLTVG